MSLNIPFANDQQYVINRRRKPTNYDFSFLNQRSCTRSVEISCVNFLIMSGDGKLQCYNRSCGQTFDSASNTEKSCLHHPGLPKFHDAYKIWSCCNKKTTDFTEFLNIKGCTYSYHSNVKPPEPEKPAVKEMNQEVSCPKPLEQRVVLPRPDANDPLGHLPITIGSSLKPMLEKMQKEITLVPDIVNDSVIQLNTPCQNKGCHEVYKGEYSNTETCLYHSGVPVFHEGMKYWSCCVKRTTDFNSFLEQVGCSTGQHKWHKDKNVENKVKCRYDWHQTGNSVIISVYSKCPLPELSYIESNAVKLHIHITFGKDKEVFDEEIILFGIIDPSGSNVTYLGSKVEIKLKKAEAVAWKDLRLKEDIRNSNSVST
ncbi:cysteine and histidine-rich domain-containing protein 1 [Trichonephila inaurata madagascariensis]|uniref:Cysteine and histidine-rich domain-containing protein 1 n=1 Tax=Trichonephila inaurata madagascariensis TaxID=2747483 RepID=A0A8X6Y5H0_9ARAC|nr:cysteine and histidine-rich domain-containing protein 1 [Trichonephila inaurata madagascariensis]